ncbi:MAG: hypothetical protein KatS3mg121_1298 [Gammaproteobacteria bacterium]|nr:MAG: hypothetical protein KatS3mg121_1298 [Gammaproteobacteria bacterium]
MSAARRSLARAVLRGYLGLARYGCRRRVAGGEHLAALAGAPCVLCFWHQHVLPMVLWLPELARAHGLRPVVLISPSRDGALAAGLLPPIVGVVRGSSSRAGVAALRALAKALAEGRSPVFAADGPRGPAERAKTGALFLARHGGVPLIPLGLAYRPARRLRSWDRAWLPAPLGCWQMVVGAPLPPPASGEGLESAARRLDAALQAAQAEARARLASAPE